MSFHHADPGSGIPWPQTRLWRDSAPVRLAGVERIFVLVAHPDDETLIAGGLVASAIAAGCQVRIVCATLGEASHPNSPTHSPQRLSALRAEELDSAATALSGGDGGKNLHVRVLGLPDGHLREHRAALAAEAERQLEWLARASDSLIVTTWRADGHPDHETIALAVADALDARGAGPRIRHLEAPIWLWHWADETTARSLLETTGTLHRFDLDQSAQRAKAAAMRAHRSQIAPLSPAAGDEALLGEHVLQHFHHGCEIVVEPFPRGEVDGPVSRNASHAAETFDELHAVASDPWHVRSRWYEQRKRSVTLASLPRSRYERVLEVGCSIGELARALAARAAEVVAVDASEVALAQARQLTEAGPAVGGELAFVRAEVPGEWPEGRFDCVVLSEVGYFLDAESLRRTAALARESLTDGGVIVSVNWQHEIEGWPLNGSDVDAIIADTTGLPVAVEHRERDFVLRVFGAPEDVDAEDAHPPAESAGT